MLPPEVEAWLGTGDTRVRGEGQEKVQGRCAGPSVGEARVAGGGKQATRGVVP